MAPVGMKKANIVTFDNFRRGGGGTSGTGNGNNNNNHHRHPELGFCQPAAAGASAPPTVIPTHAIPNLSQSDVCEATFKRLLAEFEPIIRRRGFNVRSLSEFCCCGDGLDHRRNGRKRKLMGHNVLGYNQTAFRGGRGSSSKSHTIHIRLRDPQNHSRLYHWEDVAGTMAHELSHCVHGKHGEKFFKLMEEILEEHATLQIYGPNGPSFLKPTNAATIGRQPAGTPASSAASDFADSATGGQRLGGQGMGKSRLVNLVGVGQKLGGDSSERVAGRTASELRELACRAAEARKRTMEQVRRAMERVKEPCVIALLDDSDDEDDDRKDGNHRNNQNGFHENQDINQKPSATRKRPSANHQKPKTSKAKVTKEKSSSIGTLLIDLTGDDDDDDESNENISFGSVGAAASTVTTWTCGRCTFMNRGRNEQCEICSSAKTQMR